MKIKVDKEEYERLLQRVEKLEDDVEHTCEYMFKNWSWTKEELFKMMEDYFSRKCMTVVMKRERHEIVAEVRKRMMDNIFKEEDE